MIQQSWKELLASAITQVSSPVAHHAPKLEQLVGLLLEVAIYKNMHINTYFNLLYQSYLTHLDFGCMVVSRSRSSM